ncbi:hypothetical protein [Variovorax atrisoli]|uniref:hypothetical protein n=1 Tax=Variovorax atrisoli TaxID=3394203 RepID=UPI0004774820|nr:hypothetical protein [Variovorax paradoxus]
MNQPSLDPVAVLVFIAALVFAPDVAAVVGPYLVILLGSTLGAYFRLGQREPTTRAKALRFFVAINGVAILLTVPLSVMAHRYVPDVEAAWLFGPMAFAIGLVGERWPLLGMWALRKAGSFVDFLIRMKTGGGNGS